MRIPKRYRDVNKPSGYAHYVDWFLYGVVLALGKNYPITFDILNKCDNIWSKRDSSYNFGMDNETRAINFCKMLKDSGEFHIENVIGGELV